MSKSETQRDKRIREAPEALEDGFRKEEERHEVALAMKAERESRRVLRRPNGVRVVKAG